jgi:hypothetical protein
MIRKASSHIGEFRRQIALEPFKMAEPRLSSNQTCAIAQFCWDIGGVVQMLSSNKTD